MLDLKRNIYISYNENIKDIKSKATPILIDVPLKGRVADPTLNLDRDLNLSLALIMINIRIKVRIYSVI